MIIFELGIPVWIIITCLTVLVALLIFWIWAIIDCLASDIDTVEKLVWVLIIIAFNFLGALLYFIFSRTRGDRIMTKKFKGKRLYRSKKNRIIAGVCGGIGEYFEIDPVIIRLIWIVLVLVYGTGILAYIIAWIIIPEKK